jgi:hypothetical protein
MAAPDTEKLEGEEMLKASDSRFQFRVLLSPAGQERHPLAGYVQN